MADSENSQPQNDSDEDIYKDFPVFNFEDELAKLEGNKETYKQEVTDLSEKLRLLSEENKELKKSNEVLKRNLSTLLKTAQAEVKRKDLTIEELRNEVESLTFKRNRKKTKEKFTSTDDLEIRTEVKSDCKSASDDIRRKSYEHRTSGFSDKRFSKEDNKKRQVTRGERSFSSDSDNKLGYYKDETRRFKRKHHSKEHKHSVQHYRSSHLDKKRYSTNYKKRNSREEKSSRTKESFDHRKNHYKRESPESVRSRKKNESPEKQESKQEKKVIDRQRISRREESLEKQKRDDKRTDSEKEESCSLIQTRGSKESFSDKSNKVSVVGLEEPSIINLKETDSIKISLSVDKSENLEKGKVDCIMANEKNKVPKEKKLIKNDKKDNSLKFGTKSPLDALYSEMVSGRSHTRFSNTKSGTTCSDSKHESSLDELLNEDWTLSFKNERPNSTKPVTLYSKRMMQKIANETKMLPFEEKIIASQNHVKSIDLQTLEKPQENVKAVEEEKEPGELTDDENVVENSTEFQELARVAFIELNNSMKISEKNEEPVSLKTLQKPEFQKPADAVFEKLEKEDSVVPKEAESVREIRDAIEFSPFKNNYKLIEISPLKQPGPENILDFYKKMQPPPSQTQKEIETSIFGLLSSLSGVPIDKDEKAIEKKESGPKLLEVLKPTEVKTREEVRPENLVETEKTEIEVFQNEGKDSLSNRKSVRSKTSIVSRKGKTREKVLEEKKEKLKEIKSNPEVNTTQEITPGETTQFLDFFLLTTSPSKPIVPETGNNLVKPNPFGGKLESEGDATKTSDTSGEKNSSLAESKTIEKKDEIPEDGRRKKERLSKSEESKKSDSNDESHSSRKNRRPSIRKETQKDSLFEEKNQKRKRGVSEGETGEPESKKSKTEQPRKKTRGSQNSKSEPNPVPKELEKESKEDITTFEFFKPIAKDTKESRVEEVSPVSNTADYKITRMSVTGVVCLETPIKRAEKTKNLVINEQTIYQGMDNKTKSLFSPLIPSKCMEMTPRRMLKNDLMLTDSEDESTNKPNSGPETAEADDGSESENSECYSDSEASDFVDLL